MFAFLRWKRECQEPGSGAACVLTMLFWDSAPSSSLVRATGRAHRGSTECQGSLGCWQASPKGSIFCCHHLPAFFLLSIFGERALGNVLHHSPIHHHFSAHCRPLPLSKQCHWCPSTGITGGSQSCLLPVVLKRQRMASVLRAECVAHAAPVPAILCPASSEESVRLKLPFSAEKLYQAPDHLWSQKITW